MKDILFLLGVALVWALLGAAMLPFLFWIDKEVRQLFMAQAMKKRCWVYVLLSFLWPLTLISTMSLYSPYTLGRFRK